MSQHIAFVPFTWRYIFVTADFFYVQQFLNQVLQYCGWTVRLFCKIFTPNDRPSESDDTVAKTTVSYIKTEKKTQQCHVAVLCSPGRFRDMVTIKMICAFYI